MTMSASTKSSHRYGPSKARLDLFPYCNLDCVHCCAAGFKPDKARILDLDRVFALLRTLRRNGITALNLLGKEPFLYPHINDVLRFACEAGFHVSITTNGTAINPKQAETLVALGLHDIFFSLDGSCADINDRIRGAGVFEKVISTLRLFMDEKDHQQSRTRVHVNTVLTKLNASDIPNIVALCTSYGVSSFRLSRLEAMGNALLALDRLSLRPEEEFEVAERVFTLVPSSPGMRFFILSDKPKFLEYFFRQYNVSMPVSVCGCKACIEEMYIGPTGELAPCFSTSREFREVYNLPIGDYSVDVAALDDSAIADISCYKDFLSTFPLTAGTYTTYSPCNTCPYLTTICYPCPLGSVKDTWVENMCMIADQKMASMTEKQ